MSISFRQMFMPVLSAIARIMMRLEQPRLPHARSLDELAPDERVRLIGEW